MVRSNVRRFRTERFEVWRCSGCRSIHASDEVDLDHYYGGYPILAAELDWKLHVVYGNMLRRLRAAGLRRDHAILDYGCGSGLLVRYLQGRGYERVFGYDRYGEGYGDRSVLDARYDCVISQDVIEHVDDPLGSLRLFERLLVPGGFAAVGTPDAAVIDLADAEDYVHALHLPYHRHILSGEALQRAGERAGLVVERLYDTMYNNTLFPTMNPRFALHYVRCVDDVYDLVAEPVRVDVIRLWTPVSLFLALFGYFFDRHTDIQLMFRKPAG